MERSDNFLHEASYLDQEGQFRTSRVPVIQEIARRGIKHLPKRFIMVYPQYDHDPVIDVSEFLPSISMANLRARFKPEDRAQELAKLASGARAWGMFVIKDHGVPWSVLQGVRDVVKKFFGLSFEEKKASVGSYVSVDNMGYGRNFVKSEDQPLDWIDRVTMKAAPAGATQGLHRPHPPHAIRPRAAGGLQVLKDMKWVSVTWPPEALLVNVGDLLEIMSNGRLKSLWHRVVTQMDIDRFSVALFYNPSPQTEIEPIWDCSLSDEEYKNVVVGDYLQHLYKISPTMEKEAINFSKTPKP
ncbi:PREDICTED: SRG1 [Prunus dulcis]|uniref:PREDICTED: SRG1 n=1 Tax=Prunus dulcis TaxID=3755 RepID=A0A5E4FS11_PRUDU|nr:PREDICTED: SRG1 [Prunus dulcis]